MLRKVYVFESLPDGFFRFYCNNLPVLNFSRLTFRDVFETYALESGFSTNWVGAMLRLFHKAFPVPVSSSPVRSDFDRFVYKLGGPEGVANYYRSKGFRIVQKVPFTDLQGIRYLEKEGYDCEGFIGDVHYASDIGKVKV